MLLSHLRGQEVRLRRLRRAMREPLPAKHGLRAGWHHLQLHRVELPRWVLWRWALQSRQYQRAVWQAGPDLPDLPGSGAVRERGLRLHPEDVRGPGPDLRDGARWLRQHAAVRDVRRWRDPELPQRHLLGLPGNVRGCSLREPDGRQYDLLHDDPGRLRRWLFFRRQLRRRRGVHGVLHQRKCHAPEPDDNSREHLWRRDAGHLCLATGLSIVR
jgi:hypothetical protein